MARAVIYDAHPAMLRAHPVWFLGCIILIPVFGLGVLLLLYWYIQTWQTRLTVTDSEIVYARGILRKDRTEVSLKHSRCGKRDARVWTRLLRVGTIQIFTAGDQPEFSVTDIPLPGRHTQRGYLEGERPAE